LAQHAQVGPRLRRQQRLGCKAACFGFDALLTLLNEATLPNESPA
jgi:hypothetical protein